jgi:UTP--glucose-1-phosphate uridylyltransferase
MLQDKGRNGPSEELANFYDMIDESTLVWVNQPEPRGFGDAVLKAKSFVGTDSFLVHAGDSYVCSDEAKHLTMLMRTGKSSKADATFLVQQVADPRAYGVVEGYSETGIVHVSRVVEKPKKPTSNLAIKPVYVFSSTILKALEVTKSGYAGEIQLTDGIQQLIDWGLKVRGVELDDNSPLLDIGSPELYWDSQNISYTYCKTVIETKKRLVAPAESVEIPIA